MRRPALVLALCCACGLPLGPPEALAKNLWLIDEDPETGFAIYRSGSPKNRREVAEMCALGIREIVVLAGNAGRYERRWRDACPELEVVYDQRQRVRVPLTSSFLETFDAWVAEARAEGKKIAFRCNCGCHRTGRLAAYYQMKYQGLSYKEAREVMYERGKYMYQYPELDPQVRSLADYIQGRECSLVGSQRVNCVRLDRARERSPAPAAPR